MRVLLAEIRYMSTASEPVAVRFCQRGKRAVKRGSKMEAKDVIQSGAAESN